MPGAQKTGGLLVGRLEVGGDDMEGNVQLVAELLEVVGGGLVMDVLHPDVDGLNLETGMIDLGALG